MQRKARFAVTARVGPLPDGDLAEVRGGVVGAFHNTRRPRPRRRAMRRIAESLPERVEAVHEAMYRQELSTAWPSRRNERYHDDP